VSSKRFGGELSDGRLPSPVHHRRFDGKNHPTVRRCYARLITHYSSKVAVAAACLQNGLVASWAMAACRRQYTTADSAARITLRYATAMCASLLTILVK
jgi:hypothetical protein